MSLFSGIEFVYSPPYSNTYKVKTRLFGDRGTVPHITSSALNLQLNFNLAEAGFGAFFSTDAAIATLPPSDDCAYFIVEATDVTQSFNIVHNKDESSHSFRLIREFVNTALDIFKE